MESIVVNLIPAGTMTVCHTSQFDVGRVIRVRLYDGLTPYVFQEGDSCMISVRKPDGETISSNMVFEIGNSYADIVTIDGMCNVVGRNTCELRVINETKNIGTANFYMDVENIVGDIEPLPPPVRGGLLTLALDITIAECEIT